MDVFITVPHAFCPDADVRLCDLRAREAAAALFDALKNLALPFVNVRSFAAQTLREDGDLNREEMRRWPWRVAIQDAIEASRMARRKVVLFDMHSFPDDAENFRKRADETRGPKVVLLDQWEQTTSGRVKWLHRDMVPRVEEESGVRVRIIGSGFENDITRQANRPLPGVDDASDADVMLWEFNEDATRLSAAEIKRVAGALANYVAGKSRLPATEINKQ